MCGIVGYIGLRQAYPIILNGLKRLEYRGYDSAGIMLMHDTPVVHKCVGKVKDLEKILDNLSLSGTLGIGHTRWATHGEPTEANAHPHISSKGIFTIIHNGIIENYARIKSHLLSRGVSFSSETDTEVLVNLIEHLYLEGGLSAEQAIVASLGKVEGAYGILIHCREEPDILFAARKGSPLVIGLGKHEYFVASDATPLAEYTQKVIYMNDDELAILEKSHFKIKSLTNRGREPKVQDLNLKIGEIDKEGFDHFMLKEIFEQPRSIHDTFRGRILPDQSGVHLGGLFNVLPTLKKAKRIIIIGCGTSWHAGLVGEYLIEEFARLPVEVEYGSEFRYRQPIVDKEDVVLAISQSGETADTLAAIRLAKAEGATVLGLCNVVGSTIPRETDAGVYTHAGPEIGVASTKAFTCQVTILTMMAILLGQERKKLNQLTRRKMVDELLRVPERITEVLNTSDQIRELAEIYKDSTNALYLGRGYLYPVALEGALKLKEISYIHAEGYPAAEMKHGPIALIDQNMPVIVVATKDRSYDKIVSNIQEIKARKGTVIAIVTKGDKLIRDLADHVIEVPETSAAFSPLITVIPLQLFAYHIAVLRGCNVDQPRNLAKSVTVE